MQRMQAGNLRVGDELSDGRKIVKIERNRHNVRLFFDEGPPGYADKLWLFEIKDTRDL